MKQLLPAFLRGLTYQLQVNSTPAKTQILVTVKRTKHDYIANTGMSRTDLTSAMTPHTKKKKKVKFGRKLQEERILLQ